MAADPHPLDQLERVTVALSARSNASSSRSSVRDRRTRFVSLDTVERIGIELGFASDTALRNAIKRYTGQRAGQIRAAGAVEQVVRALEERARRAARPATLRLM